MNAPAQSAKSSGTALASLICGILGLLLWLPCIPAVILGHVSLSAIKKSTGTMSGRGMAIAGLIMGYLMIAIVPLIAILAALAMPAFSTMQQKAHQMQSMSQAKQVIICLKLYAQDHDGILPPSLEALIEEGILDDDSLLRLPSNHPESPGAPAWDYRGAGLTDSGDPATIVLISRQADRTRKKIVARLDGRVDAVREDSIP